MRVIYARLLVTGVLIAAMWALTGARPTADAAPHGVPSDAHVSAGH